MMFDETSGVDHRTLIGHTGPVYGVSFSPDKYYCISCSEDGTSNFMFFKLFIKLLILNREN